MSTVAAFDDFCTCGTGRAEGAHTSVCMLVTTPREILAEVAAVAPNCDGPLDKKMALLLRVHEPYQPSLSTTSANNPPTGGSGVPAAAPRGKKP